MKATAPPTAMLFLLAVAASNEVCSRNLSEERIGCDRDRVLVIQRLVNTFPGRCLTDLQKTCNMKSSCPMPTSCSHHRASVEFICVKNCSVLYCDDQVSEKNISDSEVFLVSPPNHQRACYWRLTSPKKKLFVQVYYLQPKAVTLEWFSGMRELKTITEAFTIPVTNVSYLDIYYHKNISIWLAVRFAQKVSEWSCPLTTSDSTVTPNNSDQQPSDQLNEHSLGEKTHIGMLIGLVTLSLVLVITVVVIIVLCKRQARSRNQKQSRYTNLKLWQTSVVSPYRVVMVQPPETDHPLSEICPASADNEEDVYDHLHFNWNTVAFQKYSTPLVKKINNNSTVEDE